MKKIGNYEFPETQEEADTWRLRLYSYPLHRTVLLIAKLRIEGEWACYCTPVPGRNHEKEKYLWKSEGTKVSQKIARAAFPQFDSIPYAL